MKRSLGAFLALVVVSAGLALGPTTAARAVTSGDASITFDAATTSWMLSTATVEKKLQLTGGSYQLVSFKNRTTNHEMIQGTGQLSDEFAITVGSTLYTGSTASWTYDTYTTATLSQGELELVVTMHNSQIKVARHYILYPSTSMIQEWTVFTNISGGALSYTEPSIFRQRILQNEMASNTFYYMTGGGNFDGSHTLKPVALTSTYSRAFDSRGPSETAPGGTSDPVLIEGASAWHEWFALRNATTNDGMFVAFDYAGTWFSRVGYVDNRRFTLAGNVHMSNYSMASTWEIATPKALTGIFTGDVDDMGNALTDYQYRYKWDMTNDDYFAKINVFDLLGYQNKKPYDYSSNVFKVVDNSRYLGADINLIDDFWYDSKGDWNAVDGQDFSAFNQYTQKNGQKMAVWMAPWHAQSGSATLAAHPTWQVKNDNDYWYNYHFDQSNPDVIAWELALMNSKQSAWGAHMLKFDGEPMWPSGNPSGDPMNPSNTTSDNQMLYGSNLWYKLISDFKTANPDAAIYYCSSGGELMTMEGLRTAELTSTSDGEVGDINGYWNSLIFPIDKLMQGGYRWGIGTYTKAQRWDLRFAPQLNMTNPWDATTAADKEGVRKDFQIYHYLKKAGVVGRWGKVYRPTGSNGTVPEHMLQKMSGDQTKGVIHLLADAKVGSTITVFPKGLLANTNYTISTLEGGTTTDTHTGSYWMANGVTLTPYKTGEMIFLNLPQMPGMGGDTTTPTPPTAISKKDVANLGRQGVEINWTAGADTNWLSYSEVSRNGTVIDKVSLGTSYFLPYGNSNDTFTVRSVDGDGNASSTATASMGGSANRPLSRTGWLATASYSSAISERAIDGDLLSGWTADNQSFAHSLQVDLGSAQTFDKLVLDAGEVPYDYPKGYDAYTSNDGTTWLKVASGREAATGGSITTISFASRTARYVKVVQRADATAKGSFWTVNELNLYNSSGYPATDWGSNLALGKTVTASSVENNDPTLAASKATDGDLNTRWGSSFADGATLTVDLGKTYKVDRVSADWQYSYSKNYTIQTSNTGSSWSNVLTIPASDGERDDLQFAATDARYVRVLNTTRATQYGSSISELEVYGKDVGLTSDDFNAGSLGAQWSWVRQDSAGWLLNGNSMKITAQSGELYTTNNTARNVLLQAAPGDYTLVTKLNFKPSAAWANAGLIAYQDDDNYIKFVRTHDGTSNLLEIGKEIAGVYTATTIADSGGNEIYLRLVKSGGTYTAAYSTDGATYTSVGSQTASFATPKRGVVATNGVFDAYFDFVHIE